MGMDDEEDGENQVGHEVDGHERVKVIAGGGGHPQIKSDMLTGFGDEEQVVDDVRWRTVSSPRVKVWRKIMARWLSHQRRRPWHYHPRKLWRRPHQPSRRSQTALDSTVTTMNKNPFATEDASTTTYSLHNQTFLLLDLWYQGNG